MCLFNFEGTRAHRAREPCNFFLFFGLLTNKHKQHLISKVLELTKLEYLVNVFFFLGDYQQININIKISRFFMFLFI